MGWAGMGWEWLVISSCNDMVPWICKQVVIVISVWYLNGNDGMIGNVFVVNFNHFETHDTLYIYYGEWPPANNSWVCPKNGIYLK